jgi:RNase P subunit RPR2
LSLRAVVDGMVKQQNAMRAHMQLEMSRLICNSCARPIHHVSNYYVDVCASLGVHGKAADFSQQDAV